MDRKERLERLEGYVPILRGLISYHKRMTLVCTKNAWDDCTPEEVAQCVARCPEAGLGDVYLGALEESLRLIYKEIDALRVD